MAGRRRASSSIARLLFVAMPLFFSAPQAHGSSAEAIAILSAVKAATGGAQWERVGTWHAQGTFEQSDLKGTYELWLDFRHSRSNMEERFSSPVLGSIRSTDGWNGKVSWSADQTGDVYIGESEAARRQAAGSAYVETFAYLFGSKFSAEMTAKADGIADGKRFQIVEVVPRGADPLELWVDPATHTVRRIVQLKGVERTTTTFSDFRPVAGLLVPFQARESSGKSGEFWSLRSAASIEINVPRPARIFEPPRPALTEVQFPEGRDSVTMDFRFIDNEIYLPVSVNGQPQQGFVFDTGSTNAIDTRKAQALGLKVEMAGAAYGGGPEAAPAGLTKVNRLEIGGLRMENQVLDTFIFPGDAGDAIEGTIGYELARRTVVAIDYAARRITFMKPRSFRPSAHATAVPFRFAENTEVLVTASVDGIRGDFLLDTGAALSLAVNHPFAERNGLLRKYESGGEGGAAGVGGVSRTVVFDPSQFAIGSLRPRVSEATISLADSGGGLQEHVAGAIGNPILKQFVVTFDYAHRVVYLEKNAAFGKPDAGDENRPETIVVSRPDGAADGGAGWLGIIKMRRRPGLPVEILELDADSPAARAGILKGDFIVAINGTPVEKLTALQVGTAIAKPGAATIVTIRHGSETREVAIR